jgi:hypothetical protein
MPSQANCRGDANSSGPFNNAISFNHVYQIGQGVSDDMGAIYVGTTAPGRISAFLNPPPIPAGFPRMLLNPATDY